MPRLNSNSLLGKRRKLAPDGPEGETVKPLDKKGKKRAQSKSKSRGSTSAQDHRAKDPLEIAYAPMLTADPQIKEDDFEVDMEDTSHRPHEANMEEDPRREGGSGQQDTQDDSEVENSTPHYTLGGEDDPNVWSK